MLGLNLYSDGVIEIHMNCPNCNKKHTHLIKDASTKNANSTYIDFNIINNIEFTCNEPLCQNTFNVVK
jgi:hypothetical protein